MLSEGQNSTRKQRELEFFQTINHAQVIWNYQSKPKGILGGHINIRSILPKMDQIHNLLTGSNPDYLCVSESWLNQYAPIYLGIDVIGEIEIREEEGVF